MCRFEAQNKNQLLFYKDIIMSHTFIGLTINKFCHRILNENNLAAYANIDGIIRNWFSEPLP